MKPAAPGRAVFFEPWNLGDVIIAAAALRESKTPVSLACHSMWHPLLRRAFEEIPLVDLLAVDLPYTTRQRGNPFDTGSGAHSERFENVREVLSTRGDLRDFAAARKIFPDARIRMKGWLRFFGRKSAIVNFPYSIGLLPVENRYRSWADLAGVAYSQIEATYRRMQAEAPTSNRVAIHVGAQWRSKQFPEVAGLQASFRGSGWTVKVLAGPKDLLPPGVVGDDVLRVANEQLVDELSAAGQVITNDSGPMHLAAFLGCRTTAIVRTSPIEEWAPPATTIVRAPATPHGYRPHRGYMSDEILPGWPSIGDVISACTASKSIASPI